MFLYQVRFTRIDGSFRGCVVAFAGIRPRDPALCSWLIFFDPQVDRPVYSRSVRGSPCISDYGERVQQLPVGFPGVQQRPDSVIREVPEPERCAPDSFHEVVRGFCGGVGDAGCVPVRSGVSSVPECGPDG